MAISPWQDLARRADCVLAVNLHLGKGYTGDRPPTLDDVRGTSALGDMCRSAIGLWQPDPLRKGAVSVVQMKPSMISADEAAAAKFSFEWDPVGGLDFAIEEPENIVPATEVQRARDFILAELSSRGKARRADLVKAAENQGLNRGSIDRAAKEMRGHYITHVVQDGLKYWTKIDRAYNV